TWQNVPTDLGCCGASAVKGHAARRAIAGSSGSSHCATPGASGVNRRFPSWLKQSHACSKGRNLISTGLPITSPCRRALPRDQIRIIIVARYYEGGSVLLRHPSRIADQQI